MPRPQTGNTITFTYTAATGGINNGSVTLVVPAGWSAPSTTGANAGYTTASSGTVAVAEPDDHRLLAHPRRRRAPSRSPTATRAAAGPAPPQLRRTGAQTWQAQEKSTSAGSLANLGASPSITVYAADGSGTLTTPTTNVSATQTGRTITFTYTAATGGINNGAVTLVVPAGWSAPSTTGANAGYSTSSAGTSPSPRRRSPSPRSRSRAARTFTITYGSTAGGGPGATATVDHRRADLAGAGRSPPSAGSLTNLGASPSVTVNAADGAGTLTTPTTNVAASQTGRTITFTYTAATGGINNGAVTLVVPAGWSAPSTTGTARRLHDREHRHRRRRRPDRSPSPRVTLAGGATFTITYGATGGGGPGATATATTGAQTWQAPGEVRVRRLAHQPRRLTEHHRQRRRRLRHADDADDQRRQRLRPGARSPSPTPPPTGGIVERRRDA